MSKAQKIIDESQFNEKADKDYDRKFPKNMNDKQFSELKKVIRKTKTTLNYLQNIYQRETGKVL